MPVAVNARIATFWLPVLPGRLMFMVLQRRGDL